MFLKSKLTCLITWIFSKWQIYDKFLMHALSKYYKKKIMILNSFSKTICGIFQE
jgi:hypothetical protein